MSQYQKKYSPVKPVVIISHPLSASSHQLRSMASSLFNLCALSQLFFDLPLALTPSTSYSIHFFTQSLSSFHTTCPYHSTCFAVVQRLCHLILSLSQPFTLNSVLHLNATHPSNHSDLCPLKCHLIFLSYGQVSLPCNLLLCTQLCTISLSLSMIYPY